MIDQRKDNDAALVLLSGGQDSTVCLFWALKNFDRVEAVCFSYGQRHGTEIEAAKAVAQTAKVELCIKDLSMIADLSSNSLTDKTITMSNEQSSAFLPDTFVPGRNVLFISVAAIIAREKKISNIVVGVSQTDYSGYPDCRDTFVRSLNVTLNLAMDTQFVIHTPLMWRNKAEVWQLADELKILELVKTETVTCYNGVYGEGCGQCLSCKLRKEGLEKFKRKKF